MPDSQGVKLTLQPSESPRLTNWSGRSIIGTRRFHQVGYRLKKWWLVKMLGTTFGMVAFFIVYFWLLRNPFRPSMIMPRTVLDDFIGFHPASLPLYLSFWFYISLVPALLIARRELVAYVFAAVVIGVTGLGIFSIWPTAVPPTGIDWSQYPSYAFLKSVDLAGNACPSMHVAFSVFTAVWIGRLGRQMKAGIVIGIVNWMWCLGILYSTVASRQHVVLDVFAGGALGLVVGTVSLKLMDMRVFERSVHWRNSNSAVAVNSSNR